MLFLKLDIIFEQTNIKYYKYIYIWINYNSFSLRGRPIRHRTSCPKVSYFPTALDTTKAKH